MSTQKQPKRSVHLLAVLLGSVGLWAFQPGWAFAEFVRLGWDPNPAIENVVGYIVYHGTISRASQGFTGYEAKIDVGAATECTIEIADPTVDHYFAVAAYDASGRRSDFSEEIVRPGSGAFAGSGDKPLPSAEPAVAGGTEMPPSPADVPEGSGVLGPTPSPAQPSVGSNPLPAGTSGKPDSDAPSALQDPLGETESVAVAVEEGLIPVVRSPVNGATVASSTPTLSAYNPVTELQLTHEFQVATSPEMHDLVASVSLVPAGTGFTAWEVSPPLEDHTVYYWRVRAVADEASSPWTPVSVFTVDRDAPETRADLAFSSFLMAGADNRFVMGDEQGPAAGIEVTVPSGALGFDSLFFVRIVKNGPRATGQARLLSAVYDFGPYGFSFSKPATLKIPFTREVLRQTPSQDPSEIEVLTYNPLSQQWETIPVDGIDETGSRLVCRVDRLSLYALGTDGGEPTPLRTSEPQSAGGGGGCFVSTLGEATGWKPLLLWAGAALALTRIAEVLRQRHQSTPAKRASTRATSSFRKS